MTNSSALNNRVPHPTRRRYRLHASTYVVLLLTAGVLFFLNVPGQRSIEYSLYPYHRQPQIVLLEREAPLVTGGRLGRQFNVRHHLVHGWPCTWLLRDLRQHDDPRTGRPRDTSVWSFKEGFRRLEVASVAINIAVGLTILAAGAFLFEHWRRRRQSIWQQTIRDWLYLFAAVAGVTAYGLKTARDHRNERDGLKDLGRLDVFQSIPESVRLFEQLGVITRMTAQGIERFAELPKLRRLKLINVRSDAAVGTLRAKRPDMRVDCEYTTRLATPDPLPLPAEQEQLPPQLSHGGKGHPFMPEYSRVSPHHCNAPL